MRVVSSLALLAAAIVPACTEIPDPPDLSARLVDFVSPTGSVSSELPEEIASAFGTKKQDSDLVEAAGAPSLEAGGLAVDTDSISIPVDGFVRFTRRCSAVGDASPGELRGTIVIKNKRLPKAIAVEADGCKGEFPHTQIDGELVVAFAESTWALIDADVVATPLVDGTPDESRATQVNAAVRVCVTRDGGCSPGDLELSIGTRNGNLVAVVSQARKLLGIRDRDGLWSCSGIGKDAECSRESSSVVLEGVNP